MERTRTRAGRLAIGLIPALILVSGAVTSPAAARSRTSSVSVVRGSRSWPDRAHRQRSWRSTTTTTAPRTTTTARPSTSTSTSTRPSTTTTRPPATTTTTTTRPSAPPTGSGDGFPTPATTGWAHTGTGLAAYTGPSTITTPGTVIDSRDISTCLTIRAADVRITRSRIRCSGDFGITQQRGATGLLVEDVEITSGAAPVDRAVQLTSGAMLRRLYIHGTQRGIAVGDNTVVEDSYVGDNVNGTGAHSSAIMTSGGTQHVVVRHNTLETAPGTNASSALSFYPEEWAGGANDDFLIDGNLFNSGGGYCVYLGHTPEAGESPNTNFRFTNNRFGTRYYDRCGSFGPVASWSRVSSNVWANNTWLEQPAVAGGGKTGQLVNPA